MTITQNSEIVDRYDVWELAKRQRRRVILCLTRELTTDQASKLMLQAQSCRHCINAYSRIQVALALVSGIREEARANQQSGGRLKGLSILTKEFRVNCRQSVARLAGVGTGQVTKVQQLEQEAIGEIKAALVNSQISIHAAWQMRMLSACNQLYALKDVIERKTEVRRKALRNRGLMRLCDADRAFIKFKRTLTELKQFPKHNEICRTVTALLTAQETDEELRGQH